MFKIRFNFNFNDSVLRKMNLLFWMMSFFRLILRAYRSQFTFLISLFLNCFNKRFKWEWRNSLLFFLLLFFFFFLLLLCWLQQSKDRLQDQILNVSHRLLIRYYCLANLRLSSDFTHPFWYLPLDCLNTLILIFYNKSLGWSIFSFVSEN